MEEIFIDIPGTDGKYRVSNYGQVLSMEYGKSKKPKLLKQKTISRGRYNAVDIKINGERKTVMVHRLVGEAFIPNPNNYPQINHKDENGHNNKVENLEWCSRSYNCSYGHRTDNIKKANSRPVLQFSIEGELIKEWSSVTEASMVLKGKYCSAIKDCCKGYLKTCLGYKWKYKDENWGRGF